MVMFLFTLSVVVVLGAGGTIMSVRLFAPTAVHARHLRRSRRVYTTLRSYATEPPMGIDNAEMTTHPARRMFIASIVMLALLSMLVITLLQNIIR